MTEEPNIIGFDSMEDAFNYMNEGELAAVQSALDEQWLITWGSRVLRVVGELWIFGRILTEQENLGQAPDEEAIAELEMLQDAHNRGWRYGQWFSEVVPQGEYGSAHVASLWQISYADFREAQASGWLPSPELAFRVGQEVGAAVKRKEKGNG